MITSEKRLVTLFLCAVLLILPACAGAAGMPAVKNESGMAAEASLAMSRTQLHRDASSLNDFQERALLINYNNCAQLYAVQPGDSLEEIARVSATTEDFVLSRNDIDEDDIFPGLVLCLEDAEGVVIPPTGGERSGVEVTEVTEDQTVTVRGENFPDNTDLNVYMFQQGVGEPNVVYLGEFSTPPGGTFEREFRIPNELRAFRNLIIRFRNPDENLSASATFINADVDRVTPQECAQYYTVRSGDSLGLIAQEVDVTVTRLIQLNNLIDANEVFPGQMLCLAER
jgi:LysM repeat protein